MGSKQAVLPIIRHLVEVDDLRDNRDGEIVPGQEPVAQQIAAELHAAITLDGQVATKLVFIHSPKRRATTTAKMTQKYLQAIDPTIEVKHYIEPGLQDIHHGAYKLPSTYKPGDFYQGFGLADKIFYGEVFENNPDVENLLYRYGDPYLQADGSYRYPELKTYFSDYGENFREALLRIYGEVIKISGEYQQYFDGFMPVVFSHGLPLEIFKDLSEVAEQVLAHDFKFSPGKLARICYQHHVKRNSEPGSHGRVDFLPIEYVTDPVFLQVLRAEIDFLSGLDTDA